VGVAVELEWHHEISFSHCLREADISGYNINFHSSFNDFILVLKCNMSGDSLQSAHCNTTWEYPRISLRSHKRKSIKDNPDRLNTTKATSEYMKSKKVTVHNRSDNRLSDQSLFLPDDCERVVFAKDGDLVCSSSDRIAPKKKLMARGA
jgi:hypothetical protein